ncbi:methyltransferase-like protein 22 isoform X2 [Echeneis naucrates]|uniref:methyltransferase-like protein 22 isoform X2 n=1 Tax=Echeneis naucrates TaxID=173247 RepID=UPI0011143100|nr:methyltransferase-like protein 22 isoform X2 [Echeneis naucrates]
MDQITFHYDTVLSDVHMFLPKARHLMTHLNHVGQPVFISKFKILSACERYHNNIGTKGKSEEEEQKHSDLKQDRDKDASIEEAGEEVVNGSVKPSLDKDGDLDITHRCWPAVICLVRPRKKAVANRSHDLVCPIILQQSHSGIEEEEESTADEDEFFSDVIRIEHTMATPLEDVGKQVWRGAFLLADFILSEPTMFREATVLELGAGTGLTSIIMATIAKMVYCTDVGEDLLRMCKRNVTLNRHMVEPAGGEVRVRVLDWLQHDLCTDADVAFSWKKDEIADMYNNTSVILAADVCYDNDLTDGLFRTLHRLCTNFTHSCVIFISLEKRMNFTLKRMDVTCEAYNHFTVCLSQLQDLGNRQCRFRVEQLPSDFAQFFLYERVEQLELWKVTSTPLPREEAQPDS